MNCVSWGCLTKMQLLNAGVFKMFPRPLQAIRTCVSAMLHLWTIHKLGFLWINASAKTAAYVITLNNDLSN